MSRHLLSDPAAAVVLRICRSSPGFIPIVSRGQVYPVREAAIGEYPVHSDLSVEDFVLGLEALGCQFVRDAMDDVRVVEPASFRSSVWAERARQIQALMTDTWEGRRTALSDYLHELGELGAR